MGGYNGKVPIVSPEAKQVSWFISAVTRMLAEPNARKAECHKMNFKAENLLCFDRKKWTNNASKT